MILSGCYMKLNGMNHINPMRVISDQERIYATWMHIAGLSGYVIPFGNFLVPLILWIIKCRESHYIDQQGREVMNFQLTVTGYAILTVILTTVYIGWLLVPVVLLLHLAATIMGAVRTHEGRIFHYPVTLQIIRAA